MPPLFDPLGAATDWIDACKAGRIDNLLDLYDEAASLECSCCAAVFTGRSAIGSYWKPRLGNAPPSAFTLEDIRPEGEGAVLDYRGRDGKVIRVSFRYTPAGKIEYSRCDYVAQAD
jgi:hypothetical protein